MVIWEEVSGLNLARLVKVDDKDKTPYVYFLLSKKQVRQILYPDDAHGQINLTTNFATVRSKQGKTLLKYRKSFREIKAFLGKI